MPLTVELVSPERTLWEGEARMVVARTIGGGDVAFLPGHVPFLGALQAAPVAIYRPEGEGGEHEATTIAVLGGFISVAEDKVIVLSDQAELGEEIDVDDARMRYEAAEGALREDPSDEAAREAFDHALARLRTIGAHE